MSEHEREAVTTATCKIVTDAMIERIEAQKTLIDAEIKGIKSTIYASVTTLGLVLTVVEFLLRFWKP